MYVTTEGPVAPLTAPVSMERFNALRSLWLRQANSVTLQSVIPGMPPSLRYVAFKLCHPVTHSSSIFPLLHGSRRPCTADHAAAPAIEVMRDACIGAFCAIEQGSTLSLQPHACWVSSYR